MKGKQCGAALLAVMILLTLVLSTLATLFYRQGLDLERTGKMLHSEQAALLAISGESWAIAQLKQDAEQQAGGDHLQEVWAQAMPELPVAGGRISGHLQDLQGRININRFGHFTDKEVTTLLQGGANSEFEQLRRLAAVLKQPLSDAQLSALVDWQDENDRPLAAGAEANSYLLLEPAYRPANGELVALEELHLIKGFDAHWVRRFSPYLTALPRDVARVNVNTAGPVVLQSLARAIDAPVAAALVRERQRAPWESLEEFYFSLAAVLGLNSPDQARALLTFSGRVPVTVDSRYFLLTLRVSLGVEEIQWQSVIHRRSAEQVAVIARTFEFVPRVYITDTVL